MDDMEEDFENFELNYDKIVQSTEFLAVTRLLAAQMKETPYRKVGEFFKQLSDNDLDTLSDICDEYHDNKDENTAHFEELLLIAEMLAAAEGVNDRTLDDVMGRTTQLMVFIALEALYRKNMIKLHHDNMSFGDDAGSKIVAEKIPGVFDD